MARKPRMTISYNIGSRPILGQNCRLAASAATRSAHVGSNGKSRASWDVNAVAWTRFLRVKRDLWRDRLLTPSIRRFVGPVTGVRLLDAGCGEGFYTRMFAKRGARAEGVDGAPALIAQAVAEERRARLGIRYRVGDITAAGGLGRGRYDVVLSCHTLTTVRRLDATIAEAARVLAPRGRLIIVINHPCFVRPGAGRYFAAQV